MQAQTEKKYKNCVTYPQECYLCSEGQRAFCEISKSCVSCLEISWQAVPGATKKLPYCAKHNMMLTDLTACPGYEKNE